ncbi:kinase-like domain-containing protein [Mycena olivaceomarginata]|nr:kinase-like domain-containing protein [Mycena olivaceomarginata]
MDGLSQDAQEFHNLCIFSTATTSAKTNHRNSEHGATMGAMGYFREPRKLPLRHEIIVRRFKRRAAFHAITGFARSFCRRQDIPMSVQDLYDLEEQLVAIFRGSESYKSFLACRGDLAQRLLDLLQDLLDSFPESSARPRLSKALERLSRASGLHPTCFPLTGLQKIGQQVAAGGFGDIWKGLVGGQSVSVKIMRLFEDVDMKEAMQEFSHEAIIWRQLSHPNLLPLFWVVLFRKRLCLVSPWMSNGHIIAFLKNAPPDTDRVSLMLDVAMGVKYLHENRIVHGDLKGMNVLVTPSCRACVADFGLASITEAVSLRFTHSTASPKGGTARYQAPELLSTDIPNHFGSDVYAFGSVCYEILTGKAPFFEISRDITVTIKVLEGLRPSRPDTILVDHDLWRLLQDCWQATPGDRPSISQIIQRLDSIIGAKSEDAVADWDESISSKSRRSLQEWPLLPSIAAIERLLLGKGIVKTHTKWFPEARPQSKWPRHARDFAAR